MEGERLVVSDGLQVMGQLSELVLSQSHVRSKISMMEGLLQNTDLKSRIVVVVHNIHKVSAFNPMRTVVIIHTMSSSLGQSWGVHYNYALPKCSFPSHFPLNI